MQMGWLGLLRAVLLLLLHDVEACEQTGQASSLLPTLLVFCTMRAGCTDWPLPAPLTLRARKGLLYVRERLCACSLAQVGVVERRRDR
jgi:hypothetical protein